MVAVIQRIKSASVVADGVFSGKAEQGMLILVGCSAEDTKDDADILCDKISGLRIFEDENEKMNLSLSDIGGQILVVPNFTLAASCRRGRRPDFGTCMKPAEAEPMFEYFRNKLKSYDIHVETGVFGADMQIDMHGDGPVTIILDSTTLRAPRKA